MQISSIRNKGTVSCVRLISAKCFSALRSALPTAPGTISTDKQNKNPDAIEEAVGVEICNHCQIAILRRIKTRERVSEIYR